MLQLLWCSLVHPEDQAYAALPKLYWRNTAAALATGLLQDVPVPQQGEYDEEFIPSPCTVSPTPVVEYPNWDLPQDLQQTVRSRIEELEVRFGMEYIRLACALRNKVGGYPAWNQSPNWPLCDRGHRMEHLLSVTAEEDLDMVMGDLGGMYIFLCRRCPELPYAHRYDCWDGADEGPGGVGSRPRRRLNSAWSGRSWNRDCPPHRANHDDVALPAGRFRVTLGVLTVSVTHRKQGVP